MFEPQRSHRSLQIGVCIAAILQFTTSAMAQRAAWANKRACKTAYERARELERTSQLRDAHDLLRSCASAACGSFLQHACTAEYTQLESDIPSIVPVVTDGTGAVHVDVEVTMDGVLLSSELNGHALRVDPGLHEFTFASDGEIFAKRELMIVQGERNRVVEVSGPAGVAHAARKRETAEKLEIAAPRASSRKAPSRDAEPIRTPSREAPSTGGKSAVPYLLGGIGLAGLGAGAVLIYWGRRDNNLLAQCSPDCAPSAVGHIRRLYLAGDISLAAGAVGLGLAAWLFVSADSRPDEPRDQARYTFNVRPNSSGAFATIAGPF